MPKLSPYYHPGFEYCEVPGAYSNHALVKGALFYTLPESLLDRLVKMVGEDRFDSDLWAMELAMTRACGGDEGAGFWDGRRISFPLLRFQPLAIEPAIGQQLRWTDKQIDALNGLGRERDERSAIIARGYVGWLLTNRVFLAEHTEILRDWQTEIAKRGIPVMGFVVPDASAVPGATKRPNGRIAEFAKAFETFFVRLDFPTKSGRSVSVGW